MNDASQAAAIDPIAFEVLRSRLAAIAEEGAATVERTACSPVIAESRDNACAILGPAGELVIGGGAVAHNFGVCSHAVRTVIERNAATVVPGDVFLANDPHDGGGLHAQDVIVQQPVFLEGRLIAWVANAGHMMDMGGMAFGSWAPAATECYQEALRLPPVRIFRAGAEQSDVWAIIRNNIRVSTMVEMDLRSLVAGCQAAHDKIIAIAAQMGVERFIATCEALNAATEAEMRRRIARLEDGTYKVTTWAEWEDEFCAVPCALTVAGDTLTFDFEGAAPQSTHFFNSKPHIVTSILVSDITDVLAHDLPLSAGLFAPIRVLCPPGTVVNSAPPAPVASAHFDVAMNASMAAQQCVMMAIAASGADAPGRHLLSGPVAPSSMGLHTWSYPAYGGMRDGWLMLDGALVGGSAGNDRDGYDLFSFMVAKKSIIEALDIEVFEQRYPVLVTGKRPRTGPGGAGRHRAGAGCEMSYKPYGVPGWTGVMLGMRGRVPLSGFGGGYPGDTTRFFVRRRGSAPVPVSGHDPGLEVLADDEFSFALGNGGGYGDPADRDAGLVARDVRLGRLTAEEADRTYGVQLDAARQPDAAATEDRRAALRKARLAAATPAARAMPTTMAPAGERRPLYPGVVQVGGFAVASESGAVLARAPHHWTDGCPVQSYTLGDDAQVSVYLDPLTGCSLFVDVVPIGMARSVSCLPRRWLEAAGAAA
jgi:N-methylhydantoinase B